jgi:hypothetical protein
MIPRIVSLVLLCALAAAPFACVAVPGGSTTQPVANNSVAYLTAQVNYWQRIVTALQVQLDAPGAPSNPGLQKQLDTARWWLNWFSLALAVAATAAQ